MRGEARGGAVPAARLRRRGPSDEWLAGQVSRSRSDPFGILFERHWLALRAHCLTIVGVPQQADDAAQEAMSRAYEALLAGRPPARFRPWLFAIGRNAAIDVLRER